MDRRGVLQDALRAIEEMQARLDAAERARSEPIAVIGLACRFPGDADTPEAYWDLLRNGVDAIREVPPDRWSRRDYELLDPQTAAGMPTQYGGFLSNVDRFDPHFFGIAPREVLTLDPQQRLVLEVGWEALERAGQAPDKLRGSLTGVFVGITGFDFAQYLKAVDPGRLDVYTATGTAHNSAAGRLAYTLGLQGPAMAVDTACSSSLTAIHLACQSLRVGDSELAIAGGVQVMLIPDPFVSFHKWGMMAPDGRCKTFDEAADGFVRAEGCGMVVLKRLSDAVAAGDTIHAVIRGSSVNQDGASSGLTVPNGPAQEAVLRQAIRAAGVSPTDVAYVEAHGTGTTIGDPIELEALDAVLNEGRQASRPLMVGSAKTNVGHLEAASGVAGFIKLVLAIERGEIPPHLHFRQLSSKITLRHQSISIPTVATAWPAWSERRIGGVSSFGFSGTNAHIVVEQAPFRAMPDAGADRPAHVAMIAARSAPALQAMARAIDLSLTAPASPALADVAFTLNTGRARFAHRAAFVASTVAQFRGQLQAFASGSAAAGVVEAHLRPAGGRPKVAFLFTGQGSQYPGMGRRLYESQPVFRDALDRCARVLASDLGAPLVTVLNGEGGTGGLLDRTDYTQPALFALEFALTELWRSWGVTPGAVLGHSVGQFAAACAAGVFTVENGLKLIAARARLMAGLPGGGSMVAVLADEARVRAAIAEQADTVSIAAINGPASVVISGGATAVAVIQQRLQREGVRTQQLLVSHAFHSALMEPMLPAFGAIAATTPFSPPRLPLVCNETGDVADQSVLAASYWTRHVRQPVRFKEGIETLQRLGYETFVEIGPGSTLIALGREVAGNTGTWLPSLRRGRDDWQELLTSAATLTVRGVELDWKAMDAGVGRRKIALPTYPFERERHWIDRPAQVVAPAREGIPIAAHPLLSLVGRNDQGELRFEHELTIDSLPYLKDHVIHGTVVVPATVLIDVALTAAGAVTEGQRALVDFSIKEPLALRPGEQRLLQTRCAPGPGGGAAIEIVSRSAGAPQNDDSWRLHATSVVAAHPESLPQAEPPGSLLARLSESVDIPAYCARLRASGLQFGPAFRAITDLHRLDGEALATATLGANQSAAGHSVSPTLLDACFQALGAALPTALFEGSDVFLPVAIDRVLFTERPGAVVHGHVVLRGVPAASAETLRADVCVFNDDGRLIGEVSGLTVKRATAERLRQSIANTATTASLFEIAWRPTGPVAPVGITGRWVLLGDGPVAEALRRQLSDAGASVIALGVDASSSALAVEIAKGGGRTGVIHLAALGVQSADPLEAQRLAIGSLLQAAQAAAGTDRLRLWIVTQGAQAVRPGERVAAEQAPVWGLGRTLAIEQPELACVCVDLESGVPPAECAVALVGELGATDREDQVAYRSDVRLAARIIRQRPPDVVHPRRLEITPPGILEHLAWKPAPRRVPGPGEVEIRVAASGLNFRDVLSALGVYAGDEVPLGTECAGMVSAIGDGVGDLAIGDSVVALADGSFADYVMARAPLVARKPVALSWGEAATLPITFLTADYGLRRLAGLAPGQRVLIHAAAGGVGLAAVQVAQRIGAEIFATAGSAEKQDHLRRLGIVHVFGSRTLDFAEQIRTATGGAGVHVVLNSLTGEFIPRSLDVLADGGRFVEIGKAGIWSAGQIAAVRPDVRYCRLYLGDLGDEELGALLREIVGHVGAGRLQPLPRREFAAEQAVDAFRYMAQARHIGKVIVLQGSPSVPGMSVRADSSYLVTGGTGGLGLLVAGALIERGASDVVLASRRGAADLSEEVLEALRGTGARVEVVAADIATPAGVEAALAAASTGGRSLRGIVHAAGIADDGVIAEQTWERAAKVMAAKVSGAALLHQQTVGMPLDFFVMFSSTASVLGTAGQSTYGAANAFQDALAHHRRSCGLPAVSINWGPWGGAGMAAAVSDREKRRWREHGVSFFSNAAGLALFHHVLSSGSAQAIAIDVDWRQYAKARVGGDTWPFLSALAGRAAAVPASVATTPGAVGTDFRATLQALSPPRREAAVRAHIRDQVVRVLALDPAYAIDPMQGLTDLGMDSLMAVELRNRLQSTLDASLPATLAFDCPTIEALTQFAAGLLLAERPGAAGVAASQAAEPRAADRGPIAIVGMACRFPGGVDSPEAFWDLLSHGVDAIREIPRERWNIDEYYDADPDAPGKMYTRYGGFIDGADEFDAQLFGISRREACSMDPQHRLLLETGWEALERAGAAPERLRGSRTGVFVGISSTDYAHILMRRAAENIDAYFGTGNAMSVAAGRISYVLGLQGPSLSVDTACSSSLVTVHLAVQSLRRGECDLALAGGVNLMFSPEVTVNFSRARMLAADGRCKTFDAAADGYVRSEGCGVVVLKRLPDAIAAGDHIVAVVRGSAVNQDGRSSGLTVPNGPAQQSVVRDALADAGVRPADVGYVEAHGTGTALGDPIELQALGAVLSEGRHPDRLVAIGSVKTNIGHLEAAAGVAGLIKTALSLERGEVPAHLHFTRLNPLISLDRLPGAVIPTALQPWPGGYERRIAGVSSFGFSGTNAHIVLEDPPARALVEGESRPEHVLTLCARDERGLSTMADRLGAYLQSHPTLPIADVALSANAGRARFQVRAAAVVTDLEEARAALAAIAAGNPPARGARGDASESAPGVAFAFGDGQNPGEAAGQFYEQQPVFRAALDRCDAYLLPHLGAALGSLLTTDRDRTARAWAAHGAAIGCAVQCALDAVWRAWGVHPIAVIGRGTGLCAAAHAAGALDLPAALSLAMSVDRIAQERGLAFAAVGGSPADLIGWSRGAPSTFDGVVAPVVPLIAAPSGRVVTADDLSSPDFWRDRLNEPLGDAAAGLSTVAQDHGAAVCIAVAAAGAGWPAVMDTLASAHVAGVAFDWEAIDRPYARGRALLPTYPFQRQRYWMDGPPEPPGKDHLQVWEHVVAAGRRQSLEGPLDLALHTWGAKEAYLDRLTTQYTVAAFRRLGAFAEPHERHSVADLMQRHAIAPVYEKLLKRWLGRLVAQGFLVERGELFENAQPLPDVAIAVAETGTWDDIAVLLEYIRRCGTRLVDVLTGKESPLETLFPGGSFELTEFLYETSSIARYANGIARAVVEAAAADPTAKMVNILEVGAGTGGTTAAVLPALSAGRSTYWFTDVSDLFLARARRKFSGYPFVRYGLFDFERDPQEQGYPARGFDVVFGANTLHATADLRQALDRVRSLLAPGGYLILLEVTRDQGWHDITTALIEGWQKFTDGIRDESPLLSAERWSEVLTREGFDQVAAFPEPGSAAAVLGLNILVARCPPSVSMTAADVTARRLLETTVGREAGAGADAESVSAAARVEELVQQIAAALPADRDELLVSYVREHVTAVLRGDSSAQPGRRDRLMDLGLDSLMAIELRNRLAAGLGLKRALSATLMFDYPTVEAIASYLARELPGTDRREAEGRDVPETRTGSAVSAEHLAQLSDQEVEEMLIQRLESI